MTSDPDDAELIARSLDGDEDAFVELGDPGLVESLVINASTGFPVALFNRDPGQPLNATYYHTSRVTLADLEAGQF